SPIRTLVDTWLDKYDEIWAAGPPAHRLPHLLRRAPAHHQRHSGRRRRLSAIGAAPAAPLALTRVAGAGWIGRRLLGRPGTGGEPDAPGRSGGWCAGRRAP